MASAEIWRWQGGSNFADHMYASAPGPSGSVFLAGLSASNWTLPTSSPSANTNNTVPDLLNKGMNDFAAVSLGSTGALRWQWQDGTAQNDEIHGAASNVNGSVLLVGETGGNWAGPSAGGADFAAVMLNSDGSVEWRWQDGTASIDEMHAVAADADGTFVLAGFTFGNFDGLHQGGSRDFVAVKLDGDGSEIWRWQDGTAGDDMLRAVTVARDGSIVLAGSTEGAWNGVSTASYYNADFAAVKLDAAGTEVWRYQEGTGSTERLHAAAVGGDGSVILAGDTWGNFAGANYGRLDFAAIKLNAAGVEQWRWQGGTVMQDYLFAASMLGDGTVMLAGDTEGSWGAVNAGHKDFVAVILDSNGNETRRWQDGTAQDDEFDTIALVANGRVVLTGSTFGPWDGAHGGRGDFAAVKLNTGNIPAA